MTTTEEKYLKALKELKNKLDAGEPVIIGKFVKDHKIANSFTSILKKGGIIKKLEKQHHYKWVSINPNLHMVREINNQINKYNRDITTSTKSVSKTTKSKPTFIEKKEIIIPTTIKEEITQNKKTPKFISKNNVMKNTISINLLWGLFKYNKTY